MYNVSSIRATGFSVKQIRRRSSAHYQREIGPILVPVEERDQPIQGINSPVNGPDIVPTIWAQPTSTQYNHMRLVTTLLFAGLLAGTVSAQDLDLKLSTQRLTIGQNTRNMHFEVIHITPALMASAEGKAALEEVRRRKELGIVPAKKGGGFDLGETRDFMVFNFRESVLQDQTIYDTIQFTLMAEEPLYNMWVETDELQANGGFITDTDISQMASAIGDETPPGSVDPTKGIIEVDELVFGSPSDVDLSSKMDILLHDVQDFYDPANGVFSAVGGFFFPSDLINVNSMDIIHLDTVPGMYRQDGTRVAQEETLLTLAHEYEHLIMAANKGSEIAFISEGQAEWAEVVTGYSPRGITYLGSAGELGRSMFSFRGEFDNSVTFGGPNSEDYQRAGLWTNYLADRLGVDMVGQISRSIGQGLSTYNSMLVSRGWPLSVMSDFVRGFHVANLINDSSLIPDYGYSSASRQGVRATNIETFDGEASVGNIKSGSINPGAVKYIAWTNVGVFSLDFDTSSPAQSDKLRPLLILDHADGTRSFQDVAPGGEPTFANGDYVLISLVIPHVDLSASSAVSYNLTATWGEFSGTARFQSITYDDGIVDHTIDENTLIIPNYDFPEDERYANKFEVPPGGALSEVSVSLMFWDAFGGTTSNVQDFRLMIWADDGQGKPGELLVSDVYTYTGGVPSPELSYMTIDLDEYSDILSANTGSIYVGYENAGTDDNFIYFILAHTDLEDLPSYLYHRFGDNPDQTWASFNDITSDNQPVFEGLVLPIRAIIDLNVVVDVVEASVLPETVALEQNYPNPFNPSTSIRFALPGATHVRLEVFDLLGRSVATLINAVLPAGQHEARFDASGLGSGLYLYSLSAGSHRVTRTMTLVK